MHLKSWSVDEMDTTGAVCARQEHKRKTGTIRVMVGGLTYTVERNSIKRYPKSFLAILLSNGDAWKHPDKKTAEISLHKDCVRFGYHLGNSQHGEVSLPLTISANKVLKDLKEFRSDTPKEAVAEAKIIARTPNAATFADAKDKMSPARCVCSWKNCNTYQKAYRSANHRFWLGVVELKFVKDDMAHMLLKRSIDTTLKVSEAKRTDWKTNANGEAIIRYQIARQHYTEKHIQWLHESPQNHKWTSLLCREEAQKYLFQLDSKHSVTLSDGQVYYIQCPNVSKIHAKQQYLKLKAEESKDMETVGAGRWQQADPGEDIEKLGSTPSRLAEQRKIKEALEAALVQLAEIKKQKDTLEAALMKQQQKGAAMVQYQPTDLMLPSQQQKKRRCFGGCLGGAFCMILPRAVRRLFLAIERRSPEGRLHINNRSTEVRFDFEDATTCVTAGSSPKENTSDVSV